MYAAGQYAYVADFNAGLRVVDVSNPASPVQVGAAKVGSSDFVMAYAVDADASDDYIYIASLSGLYMIDISDPQAPVKVGSLDISLKGG